MSASLTQSDETDPERPARSPIPLSGRWRPGRWLPARRRLGVVTYLVAQAVGLFWWVAFNPGLTSYDSVTYLWQVSTGHWSTSHSVLYDALLWLSLELTGGYGLLTLAQTVAMAGGLAYAVVGLRHLGVPGRWVAISAIAAICLPAVGTFTIYVSKDTPFAIAQVWLVGTLARLVAARVAGRSAPKGLLWTIFAELTLIALFRQNGFIVIALTTAGLVLVLRGLRWRLAAIGAAAIAVGFLANLVVYPALGVAKAGSELVLGPAYADLAVALKERPSAFHSSDRALMATVAPLSYWRSTANCYNADDTVTYGRPDFNIDAARAHQAELFDLWVRVVKRAPDVIAESRLCRGSIGWDPFPSGVVGRTVKVPLHGVDTAFGFSPARLAQSPYAGALHLDPLSHKAFRLGTWLRGLSDTNQIEWLAWRGAGWAYIAYLAVGLYAYRRRSWPIVALVAVIAADQLNVTANNPNQLMRYMAAPLILGILLTPLAFAPKPRVEAEPGAAGAGDG